MAWDDGDGFEGAQRIECTQASCSRTHEDERSSAVEYEVARVEHPLGRQPGNDIVRRVSRVSDGMQFDQRVVGPQIETRLEGDRWRAELKTAPVGLLERALVPLDPSSRCGFAAEAMADDRRWRGQAVAVGVVAMMMGVDNGLNRSIGHRPDGPEQRPSSLLRRARIDEHDTVGPDNEARVVDPPASVVLHVGVGFVANADRLGIDRGGTRRPVILAGHGRLPLFDCAAVSCRARPCRSRTARPETTAPATTVTIPAVCSSTISLETGTSSKPLRYRPR